MKNLHYVKASDIEHDFCFLEVSRSENETPFMDIRISDDREISFVIYAEKQEVSLSSEEWIGIQEKSVSFYQEELENEDSFNKWDS